MGRIWFKFVLWVTAIFAIIDFIYRILNGSFLGALKSGLAGTIGYFIGALISIVIGGILFGSIIFAIWYAVAGRKKQTAKK